MANGSARWSGGDGSDSWYRSQSFCRSRSAGIFNQPVPMKSLVGYPVVCDPIRSVRQTLVLFLVGIGPSAYPAIAQSRASEVLVAASCQGCTISLRKEATIGDSLDPVLLDWATNLRRDPRGRFFATVYPGHEVLVFDSLGGYVRAIGRRGQGPGEFSGANHVRVGPDGLIYIFETNRRVTIYDSDLRLQRTMIMPAGASIALPRVGGQMLISTASPAVVPRSRGGPTPFVPQSSMPVRLVSSDTVTIRGFGRAQGDTSPRCPRCTARALGMGHDPAIVWVGHFNRYQIEKWDTAGRHHLTLRRTVPWFPSWGVDSTRPIAAREPQLIGIEEDATGLVWLFFLVPDLAAGGAGRLSGRGGISELVARTHRTLDTVVEIIDPRTGSLVASRRFTDPLMPAGGQHAYSVRESPSGHVFMDVWRLLLNSQ